ncbi:hypothetical protein Q31b_47710 [Novipirellula aureliae]|uniref:Uncharacterized protein n=2 Tax=Novipirellula aureliae TaxID=2527966 RepID=A0A5C6DI27_9BACT|nr:hypothetical protein Q31b_47710 [Novipirellula aureliae]
MERFREERKLAPTPDEPATAIESMKELLGYAVKQFAEGTGRHRVQMQYMEVFDKEVAKNFIQARGRSGKVPSASLRSPRFDRIAGVI